MARMVLLAHVKGSFVTYKGRCHCGNVAYGAEGEIEGDPGAAVNLRCVEGIDLGAIPVQQFDGRSR
jgi:hypothetical protein